MPTAIVTGAATPFGRDLVSELATSGVSTIAHLMVEVSSRKEWQRKLGLPGVRLDATAWDMGEMIKLVETNRPDYLFLNLCTTQARARCAKANGLSEENYETVDFKKTDMIVDAMLRARHEARLVFLSAVGASVNSSDPHMQNLARAEKKVKGSSCPYLIVRAPHIRESGAWWLDTAIARTQDVFLIAGGFVGMAAARDKKLSIRPRDLAEKIVRLALDPRASNVVIEGELLRV